MADPTDEDFEFELELAKAKAKAAKAPETPFAKALRELDASKAAYDALPPEKRRLIPEPDLRIVNVPTPQGVVQFTRDGTPIKSLEQQALEKSLADAKSREDTLGKAVSFLSGSPAWGFAGGLKGVATGKGFAAGQREMMATGQLASQQSSPKLPKAIPLVGGAPVLPILGGMAATAPAGAARVAGSAFGVPLNTARASMATRVGLQGAIGGATAASGGPHSLTQGDVGGFLGDVAKGTGVGLLAGAAGEAVGTGLARAGEAAAPALRRVADSQAVKALMGQGELLNRVRNILGVRSEAQLEALGRRVLEEKLLTGRTGPQTTIGINENVKKMLDESGSVIGDQIEAVDRLVAQGQGTPWIPGQSREAFDAAVAHEGLKSGQGVALTGATQKLGDVLEKPGIATYRQAWTTKSKLGKDAFPENTTNLNTGLSMLQSGQKAAADDVFAQLTNNIGPAERDALRAAMRRYGLGKRIEGVVENAATRQMGKSGPGTKDYQLAETLGATGPTGFMAALASKFIRGRGNAAMALTADALIKPIGLLGGGTLAGTGLGLSGAAARLATPAAANQSRASTWLKPEEAEGVEAYLSAP